MAVFAAAVDATFATLGIDAVFMPAGGDPVPARVIARRPDTIVGFGETRIHAETATFEVGPARSGVYVPAISSLLGGEAFAIQGEPERRDAERLVWILYACLARA